MKVVCWSYERAMYNYRKWYVGHKKELCIIEEMYMVTSIFLIEKEVWVEYGRKDSYWLILMLQQHKYLLEIFVVLFLQFACELRLGPLWFHPKEIIFCSKASTWYNDFLIDSGLYNWWWWDSKRSSYHLWGMLDSTNYETS